MCTAHWKPISFLNQFRFNLWHGKTFSGIRGIRRVLTGEIRWSHSSFRMIVLAPTLRTAFKGCVLKSLRLHLHIYSILLPPALWPRRSALEVTPCEWCQLTSFLPVSSWMWPIGVHQIPSGSNPTFSLSAAAKHLTCSRLWLTYVNAPGLNFKQ